MLGDVCAPPEVTGLILAAGEGRRFGGRPKAFADCENQTLLAHAIALISPWAERIVVGVRSSDLDRARATVATLPEADRVTCMSGGSTRQESLNRILTCAMSRFVLVHEVARPWTEAIDFQNLLRAVKHHPAVALYRRLPARDSMAVLDGDYLGALLPRESVVTLQTPQAYERSVLLAAYATASREGWIETSTAALVQRAGCPVRLIEGTGNNLKVTYPEDLPESTRIAG